MPEDEQKSSEFEASVRERMDEYRRLQEGATDDHHISIDPGSDPVAREALMRIMEERIDRDLMGLLDEHEINRRKQEWRATVLAFLHASGPPSS